MNKQETVEEAAEKDYQKQTNYDKAYDRKLGFKAGATWKAKRMYSKQEVLEILYKVGGWTMSDVKEYFEQYKK